MSEKIKSKDLSFESALPPFLQRLRAQHTGQGDPNRHERPIPRPKKAKNTDEDDAPTIVDESGDILSRYEYENLNNVSQSPDVDANIPEPTDLNVKFKDSGTVQDSYDAAIKPEKKRGQTVTDGKIQKKRKVAKLIGEGDKSDGPSTLDGSEKVAKKPKKKAKAIRLAFDD